MLFEYMLYVFIGIGFCSGFIRGWKKQLFSFINVLIAFLCVLFLYQPLSGFVNEVIDLYSLYKIETLSNLFSFFNISYFTFEFCLIGLTLFMAIYFGLSILINSLFFSTKKIIQGKVKESNKFLGGLVGLLSGFILGLFFLFPVVPSQTSIYLDGYLTPFVLEKIPYLSDFICQLLNYLGVAI